MIRKLANLQSNRWKQASFRSTSTDYFLSIHSSFPPQNLSSQTGFMIAADSHLRIANLVHKCTRSPVVPVTINRNFLQLPSSCRRSGLELKFNFAADFSVLQSDRWKMIGRCFRMRKRETEGPIVEVDGPGEDVLDAGAAQAKLHPEHLVIMVNGLVGSAADWKFAAEQFVKMLPDKVIVHCSECNSSKLTFDGVDLMGQRLAEEVLAVVRRRPEVKKISFVAHSLGGLVARYAIGVLHEHSPNKYASSPSGKPLFDPAKSSLQHFDQPYEDRIYGLEPINFITVATPHLGSRGNKQLPLLCGLPFLERRASQTAHLIAGRTGKHLFLTDNDDGKPPLLLRMVNDTDDLKFISALWAFKRRVAYANANYDHMVGWRTSSIRRQHELPKSNLLVADDKYPHIVYVEQETKGITYNSGSVVGDQTIDLEEEMIRGLTQVPWERVDVSFHKSRQRYVAHSTIQVKSYWLHSDGADVVNHMIDNFLI